MEQIVVANLNNPTHAEAIVYLLNEYAKDNMGGGVGLSDFTKQNLIPELKKRQGAYTLITFMDEAPAGLTICFE